VKQGGSPKERFKCKCENSRAEATLGAENKQLKDHPYDDKTRGGIKRKDIDKAPEASSETDGHGGGAMAVPVNQGIRLRRKTAQAEALEQWLRRRGAPHI
jgi:hypothetical protein